MSDSEITEELIGWLDGYIVAKGIRLPFDYAEKVVEAIEKLGEENDTVIP